MDHRINLYLTRGIHVSVPVDQAATVWPGIEWRICARMGRRFLETSLRAVRPAAWKDIVMPVEVRGNFERWEESDCTMDFESKVRYSCFAFIGGCPTVTL